MWYRRLVSWVRSLFHTKGAPAPYPQLRQRTPTLPLPAPLREPQGLLDGTPPLPPLEFPQRREPPTTVPLARMTSPSQPLTGLPPSGDNLSALQAYWGGREPNNPSQPVPPPPPSPIQPSPRSQPLSQPLDSEDERSEADLPDFGFEAEDDLASDITPGSPLYRRLMVLRRLVRQGVYNEGFTPDALPDQYQHYGGADDADTPFYGE